MSDRVILHSDLNSYYASVECFHNPKIRNLPVAVCGDAEARHGIVLAKNEHAKRFGIRTGHVIWEAKQLCPNLIIVPANFNQYIRFSTLARKIYRRYSDKVESFGIDECWIDVSGGDGKAIADEIRETIKRELGITASIGVSWNKIFAKLSSDMKKPDATTVISKDNYKQLVFKLPVEDLLMVGKATKDKLNKYSITTIGQLATADRNFLVERLGKWGNYLSMFANGYDSSPVADYDDDILEKSIGNSTTAIRDLRTIDDIRMIVTVLSESVAARLRENWLKGDTVHLGIRSNDLASWGKQVKINNPSFMSEVIINTAMLLFNNYNFVKPIRSLSIKVSGLRSASCPMQTDMFLSEQQRDRKERLEFVTDEIRNRFGHFSIRRAIEHLDTRLTAFNPKSDHTIHPYSYQ